MVAVRQKDPSLLVNQRGGRGRGLAVLAREETWKPPRLPADVISPLTDPVQARFQPAAVKHARGRWNDWWKSSASQAVDVRSDMEALWWWITCVFRRALYVQIVREQPVVKGAKGPIINPLERTISKLSADIARAEMHFGMTPLSRFRLQIEYVDSDRAAEKLRRRWERREAEEQSTEKTEDLRVTTARIVNL